MNTPPVQNEITAPAQTDGGPHASEYFTCADIARAIGVSKKTVRRMARRSSWPIQQNGNREEYCPPPKIARLIIAAPAQQSRDLEQVSRVKFSDLRPGSDQHTKVIRREEAVLLLKTLMHLGKEVALETAAATVRAKYIDFPCSPRALRRWLDRYNALGIDGLVEQKLGIVGVKGFASDLSQEELLQAAASALGHGQWKRNKTTTRLNIAAAFRDTVANPTIRGEARTWLHGARASKSSYPPSFKKAIRQLVSPLAATMVQVGKKAARLDGPYTNADYSDGCANHAVTADDMTANHYVWLEWPNERGFVLVRPQILAVLHVGSLCWLNARAIVSARRLKAGQTTASSTYDKDDAFGLFGDTFDQYGIFVDEFDQPNMTFILEGGIWQSQIITGRRVMPDDDLRYGGLRSLGKDIKIIHTRTPLGKAAIEQSFHVLQATGDDLPGYTGRDSRHDIPEQTKVNIARVKAGEHPRSMFLHLGGYNDYVQRVMHNTNTTRNDGKICQGMTPAEKFQSLNLRTIVLPDRLKYLYRSDYAIEKVKRNGFTFSRKVAGVNATHAYDHPALENYRGQKVVGYWNDSNPDADAVIYTIKNGRPDKLICVAPRVCEPSRLGASDEDIRAESTRKSLKVSMAATQAKTLAPYLQRNVKLAELAPRAAAVGDQIKTAAANQAGVERSRKTVRDFRGSPDALLNEQPEVAAEQDAFFWREVAPLKNERRADDAAALADVSPGAPRESEPQLNAEELLG